MVDIAYNHYTDYPLYSYNIINYLMDNNALIWKLLYYDDRDAWNKADLTHVQKASMVYSGQTDETIYKVFMDTGQPDAWTHETTVIRISPFAIVPDNRTVGTVSMMLEVYSHYKINTLSNYQTRVDTIAQEFLKTLNGEKVGGIGNIFFDRLGSLDNKSIPAGTSPYKGRWIMMSVKSA